MKISKKNLDKLIESFLFENESSFQFGGAKKMPSSESMIIGAAIYLKNMLLDGNNYLLMSDENMYSLAGGLSNKSNINKMPSYMHEVLNLICLFVMGLNETNIADVRRVVVVTSLERDAATQLRAMKNKVKVSKAQGIDPITAVGDLYSPESDPTMTTQGHEAAKKVVSLIDQGKDQEALDLLNKVPVSPHFTNNAFDFRASEGRDEFIINTIETLKSNGIFNNNLTYKNEDEGTDNHHVHVAAIEDPVTQKGKNILMKIKNSRDKKGLEKALDYMEKVL